MFKLIPGYIGLGNQPVLGGSPTPTPAHASTSFPELKAAKLVRTGPDLEPALSQLVQDGWTVLTQVMKTYKAT